MVERTAKRRENGRFSKNKSLSRDCKNKVSMKKEKGFREIGLVPKKGGPPPTNVLQAGKSEEKKSRTGSRVMTPRHWEYAKIRNNARSHPGGTDLGKKTRWGVGYS